MDMKFSSEDGDSGQPPYEKFSKRYNFVKMCRFVQHFVRVCRVASSILSQNYI